MDLMYMPHLQYMWNNNHLINNGIFHENELNNKDKIYPYSCRVMRKEWKIFPEECYWTIKYVKMKEYGPDDGALDHKGHKLPPEEFPAKIYGILTWRGNSEFEIKEVEHMWKRGWIWIPCNEWLKFDQTRDPHFKPFLREGGKVAIE
mmetsp:Transcript_105278/g.128523  ORF Transcript_105278/g.128523 Transcript_105278/m.128523 type:complete len:147 (+) Transcript_105278:1-441(+)